MQQLIIPNLDSQPERFTRAEEKQRRWGEIIRHPAYDAAQIEEVPHREWNGRFRPKNLRKKIAIARTYQDMMESLLERPEDRWIIIQDDYWFFENPERQFRGLHIYRYPLAKGRDPRGTDHWCPVAFALDRSMIEMLYEVWSDETRSVCESWVELLRNPELSYDIHETVGAL